MFAVVIKSLTLVAFSVHAVFGCCAHHHHHAYSASCHAQQGLAACDQHRAPESLNDEDRHHQCCLHEPGASTPDRTSDGELGGTPCEGSPCDGSHDCKEPQCTYVAPTSETLDVFICISQLVAIVGNQFTHRQDTDLVKSVLYRHLEFDSPPESGNSRCAAMQSWQI